MTSSASFHSAALSILISTLPSICAFSSNRYTTPARVHSPLFYRSIHHGPDVEPLTEEEKLGADYTKMNKELINNFGPGVFDGFADTNDQFDGGDSEMGLTGDGTVGLKNWAGARTGGYEPHEEVIMSQSMSYAEELMHSNPTMDFVRAQQLENWAEQREISSTNKHMYYERTQESYDVNISHHDEVGYHWILLSIVKQVFVSQVIFLNQNVPRLCRQDAVQFFHSVEAGGDYEGMISLRAPVHGVARYDIMLKNPYMGFAKFRAAFDGDGSNNWHVTPSDGVLKQNEDTHFAVTFRPKHPGVSSGYLVIETQDFKKTWKVVGSTGDQYEF
eukprot:CCRYP_016547-RA/>CCRYP_016547-RA protein AED:0.12 eAED:0.12 QI:406/0.66/0.75/1/1/1/4/209/330